MLVLVMTVNIVVTAAPQLYYVQSTVQQNARPRHNKVRAKYKQPTLMARNAFEKLLHLYLCMKIKMNFLESNILCQIFYEI